MKIKVVVKHNLSRGNKFSPSIVTSLLHRVIQPTDRDTSVAVAFQSDVQLLTVQQKMLQTLDDDNLRHYVETLYPKSDTNYDVKQRASAHDLISTCKSRYCQSLDDLRQWNEYLTSRSKYSQSVLDREVTKLKSKKKSDVKSDVDNSNKTE